MLPFVSKFIFVSIIYCCLTVINLQFPSLTLLFFCSIMMVKVIKWKKEQKFTEGWLVETAPLAFTCISFACPQSYYFWLSHFSKYFLALLTFQCYWIHKWCQTSSPPQNQKIDWILPLQLHEQSSQRISHQSARAQGACAQIWSLSPVGTAFHFLLCKNRLCSCFQCD